MDDRDVGMDNDDDVDADANDDASALPTTKTT